MTKHISDVLESEVVSRHTLERLRGRILFARSLCSALIIDFGSG